MTYLQLATKKYETLGDLFDIAVKHDWYNDVSVSCQQLAEYSLKAVYESILSNTPTNEELRLLDGHMLQPLGRRLNKEFGSTFNIDDCVILQEYYFNARYPGEDFVNVTKYDAEQAVEAAKSIYTAVLEILR